MGVIMTIPFYEKTDHGTYMHISYLDIRGVPKSWGYPPNRWFISLKIPRKNKDDFGGNPISGNLHILF